MLADDGGLAALEGGDAKAADAMAVNMASNEPGSAEVLRLLTRECQSPYLGNMGKISVLEAFKHGCLPLISSSGTGGRIDTDRLSFHGSRSMAEGWFTPDARSTTSERHSLGSSSSPAFKDATDGLKIDTGSHVASR